jgi:hypothetical protein
MYDIIKVQKRKEMTTMKFYEIRNEKTQETAEVMAKNFVEACRQKGWKPCQCRCVWKCQVDDVV